MSAGQWELIAIIAFSVAGVLLLTTAILFVILRIPYVIGDLNNKVAAKEIKAMKESFSKGSSTAYGSVVSKPMQPEYAQSEHDIAPTDVLEDGGANEDTMVLSNDNNASNMQKAKERKKQIKGNKVPFNVTRSTIIIHTEEVM